MNTNILTFRLSQITRLYVLGTSSRNAFLHIWISRVDLSLENKTIVVSAENGRNLKPPKSFHGNKVQWYTIPRDFPLYSMQNFRMLMVSIELT